MDGKKEISCWGIKLFLGRLRLLSRSPLIFERPAFSIYLIFAATHLLINY